MRFFSRRYLVIHLSYVAQLRMSDASWSRCIAMKAWRRRRADGGGGGGGDEGSFFRDCRNHVGETRLFLLGMRLESKRKRAWQREKEGWEGGGEERVRWRDAGKASDKIKLPQSVRGSENDLFFFFFSKSCLWHFPREIIDIMRTMRDN